VEVSSVAQAAAVLGVGLLYQGTGHRLMTEFLLGA
jgi:anaphase-promoting complex subunit 1